MSDPSSARARRPRTVSLGGVRVEVVDIHMRADDWRALRRALGMEDSGDA